MTKTSASHRREAPLYSKFYLLPWVSDEDGKLTEFRRLTNPHTQVQYIEVKRRGRNETGFEENLYTLPGTTKETKDNVEKIFMGAVDAKAALCPRPVASRHNSGGELRHAWARFLLSLMLRTPEQIHSFKEVMRLHWEKPDAEIQARYDARDSPTGPQHWRGGSKKRISEERDSRFPLNRGQWFH
ncbi:DUF4238 domain-containing protein [Rhizobium beringeri]